MPVNWCRRMGSNHRREALQATALPLSYFCIIGAADRIRTYICLSVTFMVVRSDRGYCGKFTGWFLLKSFNCLYRITTDRDSTLYMVAPDGIEPPTLGM